MNILSFLNISNIDNISCDSGFIFQKQLGDEIIKNGHKFTLVVPSIINHKYSFDTYNYNLGSHKFQVRFSFDWNKFIEIIADTKPDIIISNQPELSTNFKALISSENIDVKLYTYVHYLPFAIDANDNFTIDSSLNNNGLCKNVILSFISGLLASDKIFIHSNYSLYLLERAFSQYNIPINSLNIETLPPPYDPFIATHIETIKENNILYNHRLYKQYGTDFLIEFAERILNEKWKIIITDILNNQNEKRTLLDNCSLNYKEQLSSLSNVMITNEGNRRSSYKNLIYSSKLSLAPFRWNCTWSMSVIDCMCAGIPVIAPRIAWFKEFIPNDLLFDNHSDLIKLSKYLFKDKSFYNEMSITVKECVLSNNDLNIESSIAKMGLQR